MVRCGYDAIDATARADHAGFQTMRFDTLQKLRKLSAVLAASVAAVLLVVTAFVGATLHQSRQRYYANAEETSHNLAISLENFLRSYFLEVDLAMRRAAAEFLDRKSTRLNSS